jgi:RimJ/RimL family protein N-acetyltransferase
LDFEEIVAGVKPKNVASIAVLEKIGLVYQEILKEVPKGCEFYIGERYYSITKDQYSIVSNSLEDTKIRFQLSGN